MKQLGKENKDIFSKKQHVLCQGNKDGADSNSQMRIKLVMLAASISGSDWRKLHIITYV